MSGLELAISFMNDCLFTSLKTFIGSIIIGSIMLIPTVVFKYYLKHK